MKVRVRNEHIDIGKCHHPQQCMIAAAIKEFDPSISYVSVRTNGITVTKRYANSSNVRQHYAVPLSAARAIIRFDGGEELKPFSFEAKLIDEIEIKPVSPKKAKADKARTKARRAALAAQGIAAPKYGRRSRVAGV